MTIDNPTKQCCFLMKNNQYFVTGVYPQNKVSQKAIHSGVLPRLRGLALLNLR